MVIYFNVKEARDFLESNGVIITARTSRKQFGITNAIYYEPLVDEYVIIGKVKVEIKDESNIGKDNPRHTKILEKYVEISGFNNVDEWIYAIRKLRPNRWLPDYLILLKVTMIE